ncbi:MAG TPA: hypothetical protein VG604_01185 [Candidatus Saccharimonadales bacterium]|nr:hypothetical protein [Candidatus Saccharimonadales bacterium]
MGIAVALLFVAAVGSFYIFKYLRIRKREEAMAAFALQQGWTPLGNDAATLTQYLPSYLRQAASMATSNATALNLNSILLNSLSGSDSRIDFDMAYQANIDQVTLVFFQYQITEYTHSRNPRTGSEETHSHTTTYVVICAGLNKVQPNVLLLHHSLLSKFDDIGKHGGMQQLHLEGDFNKEYDTYTVPHGEVDALTLLTPDVMAMLMDQLEKTSLQFNGQAMMLSMETGNLNPKMIMPLLNSVVAIVRKVDHLPDSKPATEPAQPAASAA